MKRTDEMVTAATMYYVQNQTMDSVARQLGISRSSVSRLLKQARDLGVVKVTISETPGPNTRLGRELAELFDIRAQVVMVREGTSELNRLDQVARVAGKLVSSSVHDGEIIGVAWGTTWTAIADHLVPRDANHTTVVQINGGASLSSTGIGYVGSIFETVAQAFNSSVVYLPTPAFFDDPATKAAMWRERSLAHVLERRSQITLAVFGVGGLSASVPSHVYAGGYFDEADFAELEHQQVVGDVCTVLLRADGTYRDISLNARASGMAPHELQRIPRRICVVAGTTKARPLLGALRAKVATDLVVDDACAREVLKLAQS